MGSSDLLPEPHPSLESTKSPSPRPSADLPSYDDVVEDTSSAPLLPATTLHVAQRFIYTSDPDAPPVYELSHSVGFLSGSDRNVRLERLDYNVRTQDGQPRVRARKKQIYQLQHPTFFQYPTFEYHAESSSRQSLCTFGIDALKHVRASRSGYVFERAVRGPDNKLVAKEAVFKAMRSRELGVKYEWEDGAGQVLGREIESADLMTLNVQVDMAAPARDALVAAWVLRIWWDLAQGSQQETGAQATSSRKWGSKRLLRPFKG